MFAPLMQLSDSFRHVIDNMPCCEANDPDIEEYIKDFILGYFGYTYVTSILLGGIAQENLLIDRQSKERMVQEGISIQQQAKLSFEMQFGMRASTTIGNSQETTNYNSFLQQVQSSQATTLGGDPFLMTISNWSRTVPSNPVIVQFAVRDIFSLLTSQYFPTDRLIKNKTALFKQTLAKYLNTTDYCYGDCGGNNGSRGTCVPSGHFGFGVCECKPEWSGPDCTVPMSQTNKVLHGTVCGFDRSFLKVPCKGFTPHVDGCPPGWIQKYWNTDLTICYKNGTSATKPAIGTLCGLYVIYDNLNYQSDIRCNGSSLSDAPSYTCPSLYQKMTALKGSRPYRNSVCASENAPQDLPGTICGMQIEGTNDGPTCDGFNPGVRKCPPEYSVQRTMFNDMGYLICVKN